jgi:uncharacterized repeat protein (TIGR03803 family)
MTSPHLASIVKTSFRWASIALAFAVVLGAGQSAQAQTYTVLHSFTGASDGSTPSAGLVRDANGNLYGTTFEGGRTGCKSFGSCGTVFKLDTAGKETVVHRFGGRDGANPWDALVRDSMGNLYGTTPFGGRFNNGTVFKIAPTGKETVLHNFKGGAEGSTPVGRLLRDSSGDLYGATSTGGNSTNSGVLFRLDKFGKETVLYTFTCLQCSGEKGVGFGNPTGGLVRDSAGTFYGVALGGNQHNSGVVFQVDKAGKGTVLHKFSGGTDGWNPGGNLIWDAAGNLYGDTWDPDGSACWVGECGNVFRVNRRGQKTVLYRFQG